MGTKFAVVGSNLVVMYKETKLFAVYRNQTHKIFLIFYYETRLDF